MATRTLTGALREPPHPALVSALIAACVAAPALRNGFALDDVFMIVENSRVHSLAEPWRFFLQSYWPPERGAALYRPVTVLGFAVQWAVGGGGPFVFHLVSLLLIAAVSAAVADLARQLGLGRAASLVAGLLFAVHPVHVEAVANVVGQAELLAALAVVVALGVYLRARRRGAMSGPAAVAIGVCYALGCLSKEHATVLPVLLVAVELAAFPSVPWRERARLMGPLLGALLVVAALCWTVRGQVVGGVMGADVHPIFRGATTGQRLLTSLGSIPTWTMLLLFPWRLRADYAPADYGLAHDFGGWQALGIVLLTGLALIGWRLRRSAPVVPAGIAIAAVALGPVSNVLIPTGVVVAERVLFLPSVGAVLAVAGLLAPWLEGPRQRVAAGLVAALAIPGAILSMLRAPVWADTETLAQRMLQDAPRDYRSWWMVGRYALKAGDEAEGTAAIRQAVRLYDGDPNLLVDAAAVELSAGRYGEAEGLSRRALELVPEFSTARNRRILSLLGLGRCQEAREEAQRAARYGDPAWRGRIAFVDSVSSQPGFRCNVPGPSP